MPVADATDRVNDRASRLALVDVAQRPCAGGALGVDVLVVDRADQHADRGIAGLDPLDQVEAAAAGEGDVDHDDIWTAIVQKLAGRGNVARLAADLQVRLGGDQQREALAGTIG